MFSSLGLLDRFLAVWIFLAMAIGIILGNFVPSTGPALETGKFVGVSIPIGMLRPNPALIHHSFAPLVSGRSSGHDVSDFVQDSVRVASSCLSHKADMGANGLQCSTQLDYCTLSHGMMTYLNENEICTDLV